MQSGECQVCQTPSVLSSTHQTIACHCTVCCRGSRPLLLSMCTCHSALTYSLMRHNDCGMWREKKKEPLLDRIDSRKQYSVLCYMNDVSQSSQSSGPFPHQIFHNVVEGKVVQIMMATFHPSEPFPGTLLCMPAHWDGWIRHLMELSHH